MNRIRAGGVLLVVVLSLFIVFAACAAAQGTKPGSGRVLRFGGGRAFPPYEFMDKGKPSGFDIELATAVAQELGYSLEIRCDVWSTIESDLANGLLDFRPATVIGGEVPEDIELCEPTCMISYTFFVSEGSDITSASDLSGHKVVLQKGSAMEEFLKDANPSTTFEYVPDDLDAILQLASGLCDAAVLPKAQGLFYIEQYGLTDVHPLAKELFLAPHGFAVSKGNIALALQLNEALNVLKANGQYKKIHDRWLGVYERPISPRWLKVLWTLLAVLAPLFLLTLVLVFLLRHMVRVRTAELAHSYERYRSLFEQAGDGIMLLDINGTILSVNEALARMHGLTEKEMLNRGLQGLDVEGTALVSDRVRRVLAGETLSFEVKHYHKDGHVFPLAVTVNLISFGNERAIIAIHRDLTERKRAEEALRRSEEFNRILLKHIPQSIFVKDRDLRYITCNENYARVLGKTVQEIVGRDDFAYHPADLAEQYRVDDKEVIETGRKKIMDEPFSFDRTEGWVHTIKVPYRDTEGQIVGVLGIFEDITERRQAEEKLRKSEERLRAVLDATRFPIAIVDVEGDRIYFWSRSAMNLFGHVAPTMGEWAEIAYPDPEYRRSVMERWEPLLEAARRSGKTVNMGEDQVTCSDGSIRMCELYATYLPENLIVTFNDVTDQKHAKERLLQITAAVESATDAIAISDAQGHHFYQNKAASELFGYKTAEEFESAGGGSAAVRDPAVAKEIFDSIMAGKSWMGELEMLAKDGHVFPAFERANAVKDDSGNVVGFIGIVTDMTARKRLEEQLRQSQKMEAVGQLAGGVAHDFNNVLQVIFGNVEMLREQHAPGTPNRQTIDEIINAAQRAADLTRQLLAFSRRQIIQPEYVDLNTLIENALRMLRRVIGEHISLSFTPGHFADEILADKGQIEQVLMNLWVNARDAMPQGGTLSIETGTLSFDAEYCRIYPWASEGRYVFFSISDTGEGMDADTIEHIFEPFFTTKEVGKGTGLGLATVYGIVKHHNGIINVYSEPRRGSVFKVYLPAVESPSSEGRHGKAETYATGGTETILVAEDEPSVLKLVTLLLRQAGYTVLTATDGLEAVQFYKAHKDAISLAILDVMMPGLGGRQVMSRIQEEGGHVRFLFSSGYSEAAIHKDFVICDGLRLIQKPYSKDVLLREVRNALDMPP